MRCLKKVEKYGKSGGEKKFDLNLRTNVSCLMLSRHFSDADHAAVCAASQTGLQGEIFGGLVVCGGKRTAIGKGRILALWIAFPPKREMATAR